MKVRSGIIDVQKFCYAWLIVIFHIYSDTRRHFPGASTAVEFFMLVAGVFFFRSWQKRKVNLTEENCLCYPLSHLKKRIIRFLPYTAIGYLAGFYVKNLHGITAGVIGKATEAFIKTVWDIPLISMNGMNVGKGMVDGPLWSLSAMIIVEFVILCFLVTSEKHFFHLVCPLSILFGYGYYANMKAADQFLFCGITTFGVIRVFLLYCIAFYISEASTRLSAVSFRPSGRWFLTMVEIIMHLLFLMIACTSNSRYYRWFATLLFAVAITIALSGQSYSADWFRQTNLTNFLGEWSMTIYIIHAPIIDFFRARFPGKPDDVYSRKYIICLLVACASLVLMYIGKWLPHMWNQTVASLKQRIVES